MAEKSVTRRAKILTRIPPPRVKRILQTDEEIGKMANPVPAVIARSLEVFIEKLLTKSVEITQRRLAKTLSPQHLKECVKLEPTFHFLYGVVASVPDFGSEAGSSSGGQSTVTSCSQGSMESYFVDGCTSSTYRINEPKRRGSKRASVGDAQFGPPPTKPTRRGKANKRSFEVDPESGFSDNDDPYNVNGGKAPARKRSTKTSRQSQEHGEFYELGPTVSDDVPDDPGAP